MAKLVKELAVAVSSYTDNATGQQKSRFRQVGVMMEDDQGNPFILFDRSFNPAGVPYKAGSDKIIVSCFDPKPREGHGGVSNNATAGFGASFNDEIPY